MILAISSACSSSVEKQEWKPLFNGRNLNGWRVECVPEDRGDRFWFVEDGTIVCDSIGRKDHDYVWLMTADEFDDFHLRLKFQAYRDSPGNSGIQVRSRYDPNAMENGWLDGPQVDIHPPAPWRTGLIYDETREERRWIFPSLTDWNIDESYAPPKWRFFYSDENGGWNDLLITCRGTNIKTSVNGIVIADYNGTGILDNQKHRARNVGMKGHIALQLHTGDELKIRFKEIYLLELEQPPSHSSAPSG
jgi:hypothetical protein